MMRGSNSTSPTTIFAAAAAAMVTMAGTIWFLSPSEQYEERSVSSASSISENYSNLDDERIPIHPTVDSERKSLMGLLSNRKSDSAKRKRKSQRVAELTETTAARDSEETNESTKKTKRNGKAERTKHRKTPESPRKIDCNSLHRISLDADPYSRFRYNLKPLRLDAWSEPSAESFQIRGPTYISDRKKMNSEVAAFRLMTVDMIKTEEPLYEAMCAHPRERVQQAIKREKESGTKEMPDFVFAVNLCIPAGKNQFYHLISYFAVDDMDEIKNEETPFGRLMNEFIFGNSDKFRDSSFKLIPRIVKGNLIVRRAVGSKPSLLGKKIKQYYFRGERFFEMIVDIASDPVAQKIVKLALGYAKSLVTDICYVIEGTDTETLPERIFGGVTLKNIDFKNRDGDRTILPRDFVCNKL
jgi:hypothetical protein